MQVPNKILHMYIARYLKPVHTRQQITQHVAEISFCNFIKRNKCIRTSTKINCTRHETLQYILLFPRNKCLFHINNFSV